MRARRKRARTTEKSALELVGEAAHLLRTAPGPVIARYYIGTMPFALALLYFWADMSRSAFAHDRCFNSSLVLAALFIWMKCWQSAFADGLDEAVARRPHAAWGIRRITRLAVTQTAIQPYGLVAIPVAMLALVPLHLVHAFYQNVTVLGGRELSGIAALWNKAWRLAGRAQRQNWTLIWLLSPWTLALAMLVAFGSVAFAMSVTQSFDYFVGFLWLAFTLMLTVNLLVPLSPFGAVVAGNIAAALVILPALLHALLGVNTAFAMSGVLAIFNTTFLATVFVLSYLCLDPLVKAAHVLRCHYGESETTGEDLSTELRVIRELKAMETAYQ